jgi:hypothetical protein
LHIRERFHLGHIGVGAISRGEIRVFKRQGAAKIPLLDIDLARAERVVAAVVGRLGQAQFRSEHCFPGQGEASIEGQKAL